MTTRLDRLVLLLDTGSTKIVRSTAAKQIGQVQKQHPDELYPLLTRVLVHLNSKSWETRVAAGEAIEAICENVPQWDPMPSNGEIENLEGLLSFNTMDIDIVLERGQPLLSSAGKEFDADLSEMDPKERLALQKKQLRERLGLATQFMDVDFFDENDVKVVKASSVETGKESVDKVVEQVNKKEYFILT
jgi:TATA-binding protein-associated factor